MNPKKVNGANGINGREAFPEIVVSGTPYELGFRHGSLAKEQVQTSVHAYKSIFKDLAGLEASFPNDGSIFNLTI